MNIDEIRSLIRESMEELKENYADFRNSDTMEPEMPEDPNLKKSRWNDLVTQCTCTPDPSFRTQIFGPAMAKAPAKVWQGILELVTGEESLEEDILKVINDYRSRP